MDKTHDALKASEWITPKGWRSVKAMALILALIAFPASGMTIADWYTACGEDKEARVACTSYLNGVVDSWNTFALSMGRPECVRPKLWNVPARDQIVEAVRSRLDASMGTEQRYLKPVAELAAELMSAPIYEKCRPAKSAQPNGD